MEEFHLQVDNAIGRIAPNFHFGSVINAVEMAHKTILTSGISNQMKIVRPRKNYEMMLITASITRADFSILDDDVDRHFWC